MRLEELVNRLAFALVVSAFVVGLSMLLQNTESPTPSCGSRVALMAAVVVGSWFFISAIIATTGGAARVPSRTGAVCSCVRIALPKRSGDTAALAGRASLRPVAQHGPRQGLAKGKGKPWNGSARCCSYSGSS